jgi:hypothetical protein
MVGDRQKITQHNIDKSNTICWKTKMNMLYVIWWKMVNAL